jgi:hypothetical protein
MSKVIFSKDLIFECFKFLDVYQLYALIRLSKQWNKILSNGKCQLWNLINRKLEKIKTLDWLLLKIEDNVIDRHLEYAKFINDDFSNKKWLHVTTINRLPKDFNIDRNFRPNVYDLNGRYFTILENGYLSVYENLNNECIYRFKNVYASYLFYGKYRNYLLIVEQYYYPEIFDIKLGIFLKINFVIDTKNQENLHNLIVWDYSFLDYQIFVSTRNTKDNTIISGPDYAWNLENILPILDDSKDTEMNVIAKIKICNSIKSFHADRFINFCDLYRGCDSYKFYCAEKLSNIYHNKSDYKLYKFFHIFENKKIPYFDGFNCIIFDNENSQIFSLK